MHNCNKHSHSFKSTTISTVVLTALTALSGLLLSTPHASADSSAGVTVSVTVPAVCSLTASSDSVSNTIYPGNDGLIGTTNIKAICNDPSGLAVYAVGYTNDTYGNNKLVNNVGGNNLEIRSYTTSSGTPPQSEWNMTLTAVNGDYIPTIATGFDSAHAIPSAYTKVAYRNTMTDMGSNATGANFTAAFNAYIANNQAAGTYTGKVKFTLVHPVAADEPVDDDQIAVIYDGDGLTFTGGASTNRVVYSESCGDQYGYIGDTPTIFKSENLDDDGTQHPGESYDIYNEGYYENSIGYATFEDAIKVKVVLNYSVSKSTYLTIYGDSPIYNINCYPEDANGCSGTETYVFDGDSASAYLELYDYVDPEYDYGVYMQVYPIYESAHEGATYGVTHNACTFIAVDGEYAETTTWNGHWEMEVGGYSTWFYDESEVVEYLNQSAEELKGGSIRIMAYYPYEIVYNGNQATAGTMQGFHTTIDSAEESGTLIAPNFLKTGYGFAGWSENPSATVNGNDKIYGPTEQVPHSDLTFDANRVATLYAVWVPSAGNLQSWSGCGSMSTGSVTALTDTRDGNTYAIGKYGDGKCWMMENLRLNLADANTSITADNTNNPASSFLTERQSVINSSSTLHYCAEKTAACINQISFDKEYINASNTPNPRPIYDNRSYNSSWFSHGVLYNWYTSMAGNGTYSSAKGDTAQGDICPYGWHIPTGEAYGDAYNLMASLGTVTYNERRHYYWSGARTLSNFPYNGIDYTGGGILLYYIHTGEYHGRSNGAIRLSMALKDQENALMIFQKVFSEGINVPDQNAANGNTGAVEPMYIMEPVRCLAN